MGAAGKSYDGSPHACHVCEILVNGVDMDAIKDAALRQNIIPADKLKAMAK